jgi:tRNA A37 threonylcarbamoyladenosine dehydratase
VPHSLKFFHKSTRHAFALRKDAGFSKVEVIKEYLLKINPNIEVEICETLLQKSNIPELLEGSPDFIVDCIDNIVTKTDLLEYCYKNKLRVICSGGAGMKADPTKIQIRDISQTSCNHSLIL